MRRPLLLDLFCGAGGAGMGYHRAGFDVVGVDLAPQPHYPFPFIQGDALAPPVRPEDFDAIHASPPCQAYCEAGTTRKRADHPDLVGPMRALLDGWGRPWVMENVPTAPMPSSVVLCGSTFGLPIVRHRAFEAGGGLSWPLVPSRCPQRRFARATDHGSGYAPYARGSWEGRWRTEVLPVVWPWMELAEAGQAIPPAYTEWIGQQLMGALSAPPTDRGADEEGER